jgi:hypothetical protein
MSEFIIKLTSVKINSQDISDHLREASVSLSAPPVDFRAMGDAGRKVVQGLREDEFALTAYSDFDAGQLDAIVWPLFSGGSVFLVEAWPAGTTTSATNPKYSGSCILTEYTPISGEVGDAAMTPLTLPVNGYVTRATA